MNLKWLFVAALIIALIVDIDAAKKKKKKDRDDDNKDKDNDGGLEVAESNSDDKGKDRSSSGRSSNYESGNKQNPDESDSDEDEEDDKKDKAKNATVKAVVAHRRRRHHHTNQHLHGDLLDILAPHPQHRQRRGGNHGSNGWYQLDKKSSVWKDDETPHGKKVHRHVNQQHRHRRSKGIQKTKEFDEVYTNHRKHTSHNNH